MSNDVTRTHSTTARIAPWLSVADATRAVEYYRAAFGAIELERLEDEAGSVVVAQLSIGGADFWVQQDGESDPHALGDRSPVRMILTVEDPDSVFAQAIGAGATEVAPLTEGHGWLIGRVADPSGHHWEVGKPLTP
ncbi:MAG: VOC family protein [Chloroflexi bacterium]|nr:MAG: VOC family protein [Chloroflexota bacterium]